MRERRCSSGESSWVKLHVLFLTICHVMLSYVVYIILYCNDDWCVKDGVVHHSRQQSLVANG